MPDVVAALVVRACAGEQNAWNELVEWYGPMVWSICKGYRLDRGDTDDVAQYVWMRAVEHLSQLKKPESLGSWLATIAKHECCRILGARRRYANAEQPLDLDIAVDDRSPSVEQVVEEAEQNAILRAAFSRLPPSSQQMLSLLIQDSSYHEISTQLGIPIGSIGPTRARCLAKLRNDPAVAALLDPEIGALGGE
ncbi:sigma-70 family RNA polymerase sigma factor [Acrocarpospora sp. B8E8]|uniref:RNA polymerase sigma factor n=1 Tax=Acrocarpospora sp. B8E8 TaxID=3153572 RepID=UPI00325E365A